MIKVLLADDHKLLIDGLQSLLAGHRTLEVVGVAKDGIEASRLADELKPDVILMDISMPRQNGVDAARNIIKQQPEVRVIMLSMHADRRFIQASLRIGARGYMLKESAGDELIEAIHAVQRGEFYFSKSIHDQVMQDYVELVRGKFDERSTPLSGREREVLQALAEGHPTKQIAGILNISVKTVETHRKQIMDKLGLHSIAELTKYAIREGLTPLD